MSILAFRESRWRRAVASVLAVLMLFFQSTPILAQDVMAPPTAPEMGGRQQVAVTNPLAKSYDLVDAETEDIQNDAEIEAAMDASATQWLKRESNPLSRPTPSDSSFIEAGPR